MTYLLLSLIALWIGPALFAALHRRASMLSLLDGFVLVTVGGLVLLDVLPDVVRQGGAWVIALAVLGFFFPLLLERSWHAAARRVHGMTLFLALLGLFAHAMIDGLMLNDGAGALSLAVVLHRIPVGLTIWWLLYPAYGVVVALGAIVLTCVATVLGFGLLEPFAAALGSDAVLLFQGLVAGSLLHVVVHMPHGGEGPSPRSRQWGALGTVLGAGLLLLLSDWHHERRGAQLAQEGPELLDSLWVLAVESAPVLLLAYVAAGLVHAFFSDAALQWMRRGGAFSQALRGMAFGLPLPVCSCGVVPIYQSMVQRGAPVAGAMAFLVATPELGFDAVLLSLPLLGAEMTVARVVAAALIALLVGWGIGRLLTDDDASGVTPEHEGPGACSSAESGKLVGTDEAEVGAAGEEAGRFQLEALVNRVVYGLRVGLGEVVDKTGPWIVFGLVIAAATAHLLDMTWLDALPPGMDVVLFAILGMPIYVCASGATPLVAVLLIEGVSPGAALAFLIAGPATNVVTFGVLSRLHGAPVAVAFGSAIAVLAIILGYLVNLFFPEVNPIALSGHAHEHVSIGSKLAVLALCLLFVMSLFRQGPRSFLGQVLSLRGGEEAEASEDDDCCDGGEAAAAHPHGHAH